MTCCLLVSLMSMVMFATPARAVPADSALGSVYAYIDEKPVYASEIAEQINELPAVQRQQLLAQPGSLQIFVDNLITEKLITGEAVGLNLESTDTYARRLVAAGEKILRDLYVEMLVSQLPPPSEMELGVYYRLHLADFTRPATMHLSFILAADAATAERVYREVKGGADFDALRAAWSTTTDSVTILQVDNLPVEMHEQLAALPADGLFTPYATAKGVYLFKKLSDSPMQILALDEVRDNVRLVVHREKVQRFLAAFLEKLKSDHVVRVVGALRQEAPVPAGAPSER